MPHWTDHAQAWGSILAVGVAGAALAVSIKSCVSADEQSQLAKDALAFTKQESKDNAKDTLSAIKAAQQSAAAAEAAAKALTVSAKAARAQQEIANQALLAERAADVTISASNLNLYEGGLLNPSVLLTVKNTGKTIIRNAVILREFGVIEPSKFPLMWTHMGRDVQTLELGGEGEPQRMAVPRPLSAEGAQLLDARKIAVVATIIVRWKEPGKAKSEERSKCYMWYKYGNSVDGIACPNLAEMKAGAKLQPPRS